MEVLEREDHLGSIETNMLLGQAVPFCDLAIELPSVAVFQNKEELLSILKSVEHFDDERVVHLHQHIPLHGYKGFLFFGRNVLFRDDLHGEYSLGFVVSDEEYLCKGPLAQNSERREVVNSGATRVHNNYRSRKSRS